MDMINDSMLMYNNSNIEMIKNAALKSSRSGAQDKELMNVCKEFEALFIKQMLDSMRKTVEKTSISESDSSNGMDFFEDMLYDNYAKKMSDTADLGIAKMMYLQLYKAETVK